MPRNVMVPVDGSTFSKEAVLQGLRIASQTGATLRLVKVAMSPVFLGSPDALPLESAVARQEESAELADLYAIAAECRAHSTVTVTASLERGPVVDALVGYARRHAVDLIVMRSHTRRGIARAWRGSVADGLIRESGIPVLVVRPPSMATGLTQGHGYRRILVPLDGSPLAEQALEPAVRLARMARATLTLLMVVPAWKRPQRGEIESTIGPASVREVAIARKYLDSVLRASWTGPLTIVRRVVISSDVSTAILDAADSEEADLVAIATRGRGAFKRAASGSVSDTVLRQSPVSTLVVHPVSSQILRNALRADQASETYCPSSPSLSANAT